MSEEIEFTTKPVAKPHPYAVNRKLSVDLPPYRYQIMPGRYYDCVNPEYSQTDFQYYCSWKYAKALFKRYFYYRPYNLYVRLTWRPK